MPFAYGAAAYAAAPSQFSAAVGLWPVSAASTRQAVQVATDRQRLRWLDIVGWLTAAGVLGSLFLSWYQLSVSRAGISVTVSVTALSPHAGGWRWVIAIIAGALLVEGVAALAVGASKTLWPHNGVQLVLAAVLLLLVVVAFFVSPLPNLGPLLSAIGISQRNGVGAYLGLICAVALVGISLGRVVTAPAIKLR